MIFCVPYLPEFSDTLTSYHNYPKILGRSIYHLLMCKITGWMANSVDPDQTPLLRRLILVYTVYSDICSNTWVNTVLTPQSLFYVSFNVCSLLVSILLKSRSDWYRSVRIPVGLITVRYGFKQNASWVCSCMKSKWSFCFVPITTKFLFCSYHISMLFVTCINLSRLHA